VAPFDTGSVGTVGASSMIRDRAKDLWPAVLLFLYGSVVHLFAFRVFVRWSYRPPSDRSFPDHPLTNVTIALLGGALVTGFMINLFRHVWGRPGHATFWVIRRAALYGMPATILTLEAFFVLLSIFATSWVVAEARGDGRAFPVFWGFITFLIEFQTYGGEALILSLPFGLFQGALCGALLSMLRKVRT